MMAELDKETKFMMYEPFERQKNLDRINALIKGTTDGENFLFVASDNDQIIGYLSAQKGSLQRIKHTAYIVIGIRQAYQNKGIGSTLFCYLDSWAKPQKLTRLELTVLCENLSAKKLYEKNGFIIEGIRKKSIYIDEI